MFSTCPFVFACVRATPGAEAFSNRFAAHSLLIVCNSVRCEWLVGWLGSRVVSVLDSGAEWSGFKSQPRRCRVAVLGKLFTPIVPVFTKQRNW